MTDDVSPHPESARVAEARAIIEKLVLLGSYTRLTPHGQADCDRLTRELLDMVDTSTEYRALITGVTAGEPWVSCHNHSSLHSARRHRNELLGRAIPSVSWGPVIETVAIQAREVTAWRTVETSEGNLTPPAEVSA